MRGACLLLILVLGTPASSLAATVYTYVDDDGTVVMTDRLENVPPRLHESVRVIEQEDLPPPATPVPAPAAPAVSPASPSPAGPGGHDESGKPERRWSRFFWNALPEEIVPGLTQYQSVLLIGGFVVGSFVFAALMLTRNPALQFALKWALIFVAGGTFYGIYFAELGTTLSVKGEEQITDPRTVLDRVRVKVKRIEERQAERIQRMEHLPQVDAPEEGGQP